ncbi:hypothetical protein ACGFNP_00585 [Nonomuraea sp. NPDC049269]|uniref:hypothetical protein n=1 Tax=Nonomuraea sp. NPDC049269 TaxID=3364349 RepID=UPI00371DA3C3
MTVTGDGEAKVGVLIAAPSPEGSVHRVTAVAEGAGERRTLDGSVEAAATGWTMWMVSHFRYDFIRIMLPLSRPIIMTLAIMSFQWRRSCP